MDQPSEGTAVAKNIHKISIHAKISTVDDLDKLISQLQEIKATLTDGDEIEFDLN
jgi:hypothetical protein